AAAQQEQTGCQVVAPQAVDVGCPDVEDAEGAPGPFPGGRQVLVIEAARCVFQCLSPDGGRDAKPCPACRSLIWHPVCRRACRVFFEHHYRRQRHENDTGLTLRGTPWRRAVSERLPHQRRSQMVSCDSVCWNLRRVSRMTKGTSSGSPSSRKCGARCACSPS